MTELFTTEWADSLAEKLATVEAPSGGSGVVEWVVSGGDPDRIWVRWQVDDGRITGIDNLEWKERV